jgi:hypothetical protein
MDYCPDDTRCAQCDAVLPDNPAQGSPAFDGFCDDECKAAMLVTAREPWDDSLTAPSGQKEDRP